MDYINMEMHAQLRSSSLYKLQFAAKSVNNVLALIAPEVRTVTTLRGVVKRGVTALTLVAGPGRGR
jgi:hypothetical protein